MPLDLSHILNTLMLILVAFASYWLKSIDKRAEKLDLRIEVLEKGLVQSSHIFGKFEAHHEENKSRLARIETRLDTALMRSENRRS